MHGELGNRPRGRRLAIGARQAGADETPMRQPSVFVNSLARRFSGLRTGVSGDGRRRDRFLDTRRGDNFCERSRARGRHLEVRRRAGSRTNDRCGGRLLLPTLRRFFPVLVDVLGVARRTACLADGVFDNRDDRMIRDASFTRTIVVHDVAETQRALLHSVLPTDFISGSHARHTRHCSGAVQS
jgi:hypothetical protein